MKFSIEAVSAAYSIHAYDTDHILIKVAENFPSEMQREKFELQRFEHSFIITATKLIDWSLTSISAIESSHLDIFYSLDIEVLLLASHYPIQFLSPQLSSELQRKGIGIECMEIGAACRTYNLLLAEHRPVGLAVIFQNALNVS